MSWIIENRKGRFFVGWEIKNGIKFPRWGRKRHAVKVAHLIEVDKPEFAGTKALPVIES